MEVEVLMLVKKGRPADSPGRVSSILHLNLEPRQHREDR